MSDVQERRYLTAEEGDRIREMSQAGVTVGEIAAELGRSARTVSRWRVKNHLAMTPGRRLTEPERAWARAVVQEGMPIVWVAETLDIDRGAIRNIAPATPEGVAGWKSVWGQIRYDPALIELHREFAP